MLSKAQLKEQAINNLAYEGIKYTEHNNGYHFRIGKIDFFPTTGKWLDIDNDIKGNSVSSLISYIKKYKKSYSTVFISCPCCRKSLQITLTEAV